MHMYGAALYWHLATTIGESIVDVDKDLLRGKRVLEVECMRGGGARYLAEVTGASTYVATDEREENIEACLFHQPLPSLSYEQLKLSDLSKRFDAGAFDALLCIEAGAGFDKEGFVDGAKHVLESGGLVLMCDAFMQDQLRELLKHLEQSFDLLVCTDIGKWVRATGLSPVDIAETHSIFGVAPCTYMRIVARKK